jgi:hypothetical protein
MTWKIHWQDSRTGRVGTGTLTFTDETECAKLCAELNADYPQFKHMALVCDDAGKPQDILLTPPATPGNVVP